MADPLAQRAAALEAGRLAPLPRASHVLAVDISDVAVRTPASQDPRVRPAPRNGHPGLTPVIREPFKASPPCEGDLCPA